MQSDGGLVDFRKVSGLRAILSGPAGGVVGFARTSYDPESGKPIIGLDMGGTSTDVSRYAGRYEHIFETTTAGVSLQCPQLDINTVAAGGGSKLYWRNGLLHVGPESASAHPGPACYRKGGPLTVTDANLCLGRLIPAYFPKIFGKNEDEDLDTETAKALFTELTATINNDLPPEKSKLSVEEVAAGFIRVANESMCRAIRTLTEARGHDAAHHDLAVFGGAGGQHACSIAANLGIQRVILHKYSSILSAYGLALADVVCDVQDPLSCAFNEETLPAVKGKVSDLLRRAREDIRSQGMTEDSRIEYEVYINMRYDGSDTNIMIPQKGDDWALDAAFVARHRDEFGFTMPRAVYVEDVRVRAAGKSTAGAGGDAAPAQELANLKARPVPDEAMERRTSVYFEGTGWAESPVYLVGSLKPGDRVAGPAVIIDNTQTILIVPDATATALKNHIVIELGEGEAVPAPADAPRVVDPVQLSVFGHRFMGIAEQVSY